MITILKSLFKLPFKALLLVMGALFFSSHSQAISLSLDNTSSVESGTDCEIATYRFGLNETWNGNSLDLLVEVVAEDNEFSADFCVGISNGIFAVHLRDTDAGDDVAFVDTVMTIVQRGTLTPVFVDRITATGFDLDRNTATGASSTATDDIYFSNIGAAFVSGNTFVTYEDGTFNGAHDVYLRGRDSGDCQDSPANPAVDCRASASWTGGATNQISSFGVRFQNDNAYGQTDPNALGALRLLQLSLEDSHAEELLGAINDYGDTPASYGVADHPSVSVFTILGYGLAPDHDANPQGTAGADGDDNDAAAGTPNYDDEDGIFRNGSTLQGQTLTAGVNEVIDVTTFGTGYLSGWVDLNHDGDFLDADENVLSDVFITSTTTQITSVSMNIPLTAVGGTAYARFRFDTQQGLAHNGSGTRGEVEDYQIYIDPMDPTYNMVKSASSTVTTAGPMTYTFTFENTGNVPLSNLTISDPDIDGGSLNGCPIATLAVGASASCTATRTVSQAQIDSGNNLLNTATPSALDPIGAAAIEDSTLDNSTQTTISATYSHSIDKTAPSNADEDGSGDISVGDTLTYTVTATNTGTGTLTNLLVEDPMLSPASSNCASVSPAGTCVLTGNYTVSAADVSAGVINNVATAASDQTASLSDSETVNLPAPALAIAKPAPVNADEDGSGDVSAGDTLTYTVTATNSGAATLTSVVVNDPMLSPNSTNCATVTSGNTCVLIGTYTVLPSDVTAGSINNTATTDSVQTLSVDASHNLPLPTPLLSVVKSAPANGDQDSSGDISVNDVLTYTITVTNSGAATLTNVVVSDPLITPNTTSCASLASGATCVLTGIYTVTAADVTAGQIDNSATANADQVSPVNDGHTVPVSVPGLSLDKAAPSNADEDGSTDVGVADTLTYTITATNTGASTLTNVVVNDPMLTPDTNTCASVAAGGTCVLTGSYSVIAADVAAGSIVNTASADSVQTAAVTDTETVLVPSPALTLNKPAPVNADEDSSTDVSVSDTLTYTITATNSGAAVLTNVVVSDPLITPNTTTCAQLAPTATCVLTGTYSVTGADVAAGVINNTATANSDQTPQADDAQAVVVNAPAHTIDKAAPVNADEDGSGDISVADTLTYTITATNSGSATLTNMVVSDPMLTPNSNSCASVAPGATCVLTGEYTVTQADVTAQSIVNTASGVTDQTTALDDTETVSVPTPALAIVKAFPVNADEDGSGDISAGDTLTYTITATNSGSASLTNLLVNDPMITPNSTNCALVAPNATCVLTGTYSVTTADVTAASIVNTATANSDQTGPADDTHTVTLNAPAHTLDKAAPVNADEDGSTDISAGDTLTYTITATNTGSAMLTDMVVTDAMLSPDTQSCATVAPAATCVLTGTYVVTAADVTAGSIVNTAGSDTDQTGPQSDTETVGLPTPALSLVKAMPVNADEDGSTDISAGDTLTYTITATNSGSAVLTDLVVSDAMITPTSTTCASVAPGATCVLSGTYSVTAADVAAGQIVNTATADTTQTPSVDDIQTVNLGTPSHVLEKASPVNADEDGSLDISAGDTLSYTITATNNGTSVLTNMVVTDAMLTPASATCASVAAGGTCVLTGSYVVSAADVTAGSIVNTASSDTDQTAVVDDSVTVVVPAPVLSVVKSVPSNNDADNSGDISAGDTLSYTITATNSGAANLTNLVVSDALITPATSSCALVTAGSICVLNGTYVVTAADITAGQIDNTASADSDQTAPADDTQSVVLNAPSLTISKAAPANADEDGSADVSVGDTLTYTITATNNGSSNLTNVVVADALITPNTITCATLTPGNTCVLSGDYQVTSADITNTQIDNTASANSDQAGPVDDTHSVVLNTPQLQLVKSVPVNADEDGSTDVSAADTLTYTVTATNSGSSNLTNVVVTDVMITPDTHTCAFVASGATCELVGTYSVTAADVTAGVVDNTANAQSDQTPQIADSQSVVLSTPAHVLDKSAPVNADEDGSTDISAGDTLAYTVTATNNSTANLTNMVVNDAMLTPDTISCALVAPGATCVLTGNYSVTSADVVAGSIVNTAGSDTDQTGPQSDTQTVTLPTPALSLVKSMPVNADEDGSTDISVGDTLAYTITATNSGSAVLTDLLVNDGMITPSSTTCASVAPGATCVLSGTYSVTAADVTAGQIVNTATADSTQTAPVDDTQTVNLNTPSHVLEKTAPVNADEDGSLDISAGDTLTYTITATNNGTSVLTNMAVTDAMLTPASATCASVAAGGTCVLTGSYVVSAADVAAGSIVNTASSDTDQTDVVDDSVTVVVPAPALSVVKSLPSNNDADNSGDISAGDILSYTITATNSGAANLTNLVVSDPLITPDTTTCALVTAGSTCVLSGTYSVTATDVTAGRIDNTANADSDQTPQVDDTQSVVLNAPSLTISKAAPANADEDGSADISVGDTLTYTITATNNGSSNLTNVVVTDALITPDSITCATVIPGGSCVLGGVYQVAATDVANGQIVNTASANSDQAGPVDDTHSVVLNTPQLQLVKSVPLNSDEDGSTDVSAADTLTYTVTATNSGTSNLTNVVVTDVMITPDTQTCAFVAPGATCELIGTYSVTAADVTAGVVDNTANAQSDQTPQDSDSQSVVISTPAHVLDKSAPVNADEDGSTDISAGDTLTYTVTATNNSAANLTNMVVNDAMLTPDTISCALVAPGSTCVLTGTYTVTTADVAAGSIVNTASSESDQTGPQQDTEMVNVPAPAIALSKPMPTNADEDGSGDISAGDTLSYTITATNSGAAVLTGVAVSDVMIQPSSQNCASLVTGATCVLTGTYSVTAADVAAGVINNTATADSDQIVMIDATRSVVLNAPGLQLTKSAPVNADEDGSSDVSAGDTLTYTVTATNNGSSNLTNVVVADPMIVPDTMSCGVLASGNDCTLTGTYTVTAADITAGRIDNTASAVSDQTPSQSDTQSVLLNVPSHVLDKTAPVNADEDGSTDISVGDTLTYTITATNNGAATLTNLIVNDPMLTPSSQLCASVLPSATCVLTGTYTVVNADVAAGGIVNTASSVSDQTVEVLDTETVLVPTPGLSLNKSAPSNADEDGSSDISIGDTLTYTITVSNSGNATLTNVVVSDPMVTPDTATCDLLAPGALCVLSGSYVVSSADIAAGSIVNVATANTDQVGPVEDTETTPLNAPALSIVKATPANNDEDGSGDISAGDTLSYTITATNNGSSNLTNVVVTDLMLTPSVQTCLTLQPGADCVLTGSYTVVASDVAAAQIENTASVDSDQAGPSSNTVTTTVLQPAHAMTKSVPVNSDEDGSGDISVGDTLVYTITATNTGSAVLTNLSVSDAMITPATITCPVTMPGGTCVLTGEYVVSAQDVTTGQIDNTAVSVSDQSAQLDTSRSDMLNSPQLELVKNAPANADEDNSGDISVGDTLTYTVSATNNGTSTLTNVVVLDSRISPDTTNCPQLAPAESCVLSGTYVVVSSDVLGGQINNTASANADQFGPVTASNVQPLGAPSLTLSKSEPVNTDEDGSADISVGDTLTYTVTANNNGGSSLTNVVVNDSMITPADISCAVLPVGGSCVLTGSYTVTAGDQAAGQIVNTAQANSDQTLQLQDSVTVAVPAGSITLSKSLAGNTDEDTSGDVSVGDSLSYRIVATNTGNSTLTAVVVTDELLTPAAKTCVTLAPAQSCELVGTYSVTEADVTSEVIVNTATVESAQLAPITDTHELSVPSPSLAINKAAPVHGDADESGNVSVGDLLQYTVTATNNGSAVLTDVIVTDSMLDPETITCERVAAEETCVLVGTYTVSAEDADAGQIVNTATADSVQTSSVSDSVTVDVVVILPPVTVDDSKTDQPLGTAVTLDVLADDSDPESNIDPTTVVILDPQNGDPLKALVVPGEGSWSVDAQSGAITFTPEAGFMGDPTPVQYTVTDTTGLTSNISMVSVDYEAPASLTGTVWLDIDRDGEIDGDEPVKPNWTLEIYDDQGVLVASTVTDENGQYSVEDLIPGEFTVKFFNDAGVYIAESSTDGVVEGGTSVDLPLPVDPSGIVYDSITREPIPGVTLVFNNSAGIAVDPACLNTNQQSQTTGADGFYAFDVFPEAHATCPDGETYTIEIVNVPGTYIHAMSVNIPAETQVYDSAGTEAACTLDAIPTSGACEVQANAGAPQSGQDTRYFMSFTLAGGDTNVIFNHIPLDPVILAAQSAMRLQKTASRAQASTGDVVYYTITLENDLADEATDVSVTDDLPMGFRYIDGSAVVTIADATGNVVSQAQPQISGVDPMVFGGLSVPAFDIGTTTISYAVRIGAAVMAGSHVNTAQVSDGGTSNIGRAGVQLVADPVLAQATLIGKVFHDRDDDGYQEDARATNVVISSDYFGAEGKFVGDLPGRGSEREPLGDNRVVVYMPVSEDNSFELTTDEGSYLSVDNNQQIMESHRGIRAHGMTAQDIRIETQMVDAVPTPAGDSISRSKTRVLQITITNAGIHEKGLPGVRLATVGGLLIETDQAGRFHIPDSTAGDSMIGQQFILKLDTATLPSGATLTTENPRVLRISSAGLNVMNFGVSLPASAAAPKASGSRVVEVYLGSVFFDTDKHNIRPDQRGVVQDIIANLRKFKSGQILIEAHTDSRQSMQYNIALAKRRAKEVESELRRILGDDVMQHVDVEVDASAFKEVPNARKAEKLLETEQ